MNTTDLDSSDFDKIEKINRDFMYVHESFTSRDSKTYESFLRVLNHSMKDGRISKMNKELIAVGISALLNCEPCITWHTREALKSGATDGHIAEALEVAIEMGGGPVIVRSSSFAFKVLEYFRQRGTS
ncbi:MAG: carboxymuconolactone decarboxylase family protein [Spirochaetes bacterium]|nr:carboxymuconolactone decarboxylase family protein [Spirochaetota bacterium]